MGLQRVRRDLAPKPAQTNGPAAGAGLPLGRLGRWGPRSDTGALSRVGGSLRSYFLVIPPRLSNGYFEI